MSQGKVFLVGAGPGDPGLLTLRAAELIAGADLVAARRARLARDRGALPEVGAEVVYVGKRASAHTLPQDQINQLLVDEARKGKRVVRLKGGDPFVFGRGGEEAEELVAAGVPFEIVPGISSSIAGPAYAGIPVTHRSYATSLTLVTGHESARIDRHQVGGARAARRHDRLHDGAGEPAADRAQAAASTACPADRRVAVISKATTAEQRTVAGTLATSRRGWPRRRSERRR